MLRTRVWTALIALPALLAIVLFAPASWFAAFIAIVTAWGLYEVGAMTGAHKPAAVLSLLAAGGGSAILLAWAPAHLWPIPLGVTLAMLALVERVRRGAAVNETAAARPRPGLMILGGLYVGALFPYFALLRNRSGGVAVTIFVLLLVMASDTGAYFAGSKMGRTLLVPRVSPKKTVEGAIGGFILCVVAGLILNQLLVLRWGTGRTIALSIAIGVLAQVGDLAGSALKRSAGVKDSGWIFPGHGGLIDRTCSMVFAMVMAYYCA